MKNPLKIILSVLALTITQNSIAEVVSIDFENLSYGDNQYFFDLGNGFTMDASTHFDVTNRSGSKAILVHGNCCGNYSVRFERTDEKLFDFISADNLSGYWFDIRASSGATAVFEQSTGTHTLTGSQWENLSWVEVGTRGNVYFDNVVLNVAEVPLPSAAYLFLSSIIALAYRKNNKT